jgi:hypothetical protein
VRKDEPFDVCVVDSGASGDVMAKEACSATSSVARAAPGPYVPGIKRREAGENWGT